MRIIIVSSVDLANASGDTIRVEALSRGLYKNGFNTTLIVPAFSSKPILDLGNLQIEPIQIKSTKNNKSLFHLLARNILLIIKVRQLMKKDFILQIETSGLGGYFAFFLFSNYILDVHGLEFDEFENLNLPLHFPKKIYKKYLFFLEKMAMKRALKIVVVSNKMKQFLIEDFNINEKKIEVIPNGFFEEFFEKDNYILNEKLITFVGLLTKWASVEKVIYAASKIKDEKVKFLIIGDGPEKSNLEKLANYYNLKNIIFTGSLPIKEVYHYLAISDILICPLQKRLALEVACPIKLLEYAGMAKPIIVDYVGEIPELFYENKAALVSYDLISFIKNVELLIYNDDLKKSLSNNAKKISNDYTWDKQVDKMILLYKNLIR